MTSIDYIPELLAPAGSNDALRAAVANGADAVYLGVESLNARRGAENFTLEKLAEATYHAHVHDVAVYLTANVLVLPQEVGEALEIVDRAWSAGVDAVIVQDLGLLSAITETMPDVRVHASTQIGTHNTATIETLAGLGVSRVTLARELSVDEITLLASVAAEAGIEVESFVHGALCVCYSGQCLLSSLIGGRSANRGTCAQPCRLPYELVAGARTLEVPGAHLLSPKDLAGIDMIPALVDTGVSALKVEGRMKSAEYVAVVTATYRDALDRYAQDPDAFEVRDAEHEVLAEAFSRGLHTAYLGGARGNEIMSYRRPNNRGVPVGRVSAADAHRATIAFDKPVDSADTIEVWTSSGRVTQRVGSIEVEGRSATSAPAGVRAVIATESPVRPGDRVFRVANAALLDAARRTWERGEGSMQLAFAVRVVKGEPLTVTVTDEEGITGTASGAVVEAARTKAISAEEVTEHVGRLGGTEFVAASWEVDLSPDVGLGYSQLHRVRREAIEAYERELLAPWSRRARVMPVVPALTAAPAEERTRVSIVVSCDNLGIARAALNAGADEAHVPISILPDEPAPGIIGVVPRIVHEMEAEAVRETFSEAPAAVVGNLGFVTPLAASGVDVQAHWGLNVTNPWTAASLADLGARRVWASPELSGRQLRDVVAASPVAVGTGVWGRQELMVTEHCILMAEGECSRACGSCARRKEHRTLRDRKGYEFPVITDESGRSHLYNAVPMDLTKALSEVVDSGVSAIRLDVTTEGAQRVSREVARWRRMLQAVLAGVEHDEPEPRAATTTTGHFYRGVS